MLCFNEVPEAALHKFWDSESIGISDAPVEAAYVSAVFKQHIKYVDGRYEVGFPWKPGMADTLQDRGARWLSGRMPDSQSREPGFESPLIPFRSLGIFFHFTTPQSTQLYK